MRRHSIGSREAARKITTWPLTTNDSTAYSSVALKNTMCGRTGAAPVFATHIVVVAPPRSIVPIGELDKSVPLSFAPSKM